MVTEIIVPGFRSLATGARKHEADWRAYCGAPSRQGRDALVSSFHDLADRWASVEMFRTGPAVEDFCHERFYFWPERKNAAERALNALMKSSYAA